MLHVEQADLEVGLRRVVAPLVDDLEKSREGFLPTTGLQQCLALPIVRLVQLASRGEPVAVAATGQAKRQQGGNDRQQAEKTDVRTRHGWEMN